jgi:hypothetical protein
MFNNEQIIEMAKQAGIFRSWPCPYTANEDELQAFAQLVRNAALEEAALVASKHLRNTAMLMSSPPKSSAAWEIEIEIKRLKS